jgi:hypothetical protein
MPQNGEINRRFRSFRDNVPRLRDTFGIATGILPCQASRQSLPGSRPSDSPHFLGDNDECREQRR